MSTEVSITVYDITQQGYYAPFKNDKPEFGDINSILTNLQSWAQYRNIEDTLFTLDNANTENSLPTLLASINQHSNQAWLLTLWNQVPDQKGKILSISRRRKVGDARYSTNAVAKDTIAGFPSYYWIIPHLSIVATIRVHSLPTVPSGLQAHLQHFMGNHSKQAVKSEVDADDKVTILGYRECDVSPIQPLRPRFKIKIRRKPSNLELLRSKVEAIYRFEHIEKYSAASQVNDSTWQKRIPINLRGNLNLSNIQNIKTEQSFKTELGLDDLNFLIRDWEEHLQDFNKEIDYKFYLRRENRPYILGSSIARDKFNFDLSYDENTGIITPESLLKELEKQSGDIIENLINDE